jgi:hypothetical protein
VKLLSRGGMLPSSTQFRCDELDTAAHLYGVCCCKQGGATWDEASTHTSTSDAFASVAVRSLFKSGMYAFTLDSRQRLGAERVRRRREFLSGLHPSALSLVDPHVKRAGGEAHAQEVGACARLPAAPSCECARSFLRRARMASLVNGGACPLTRTPHQGGVCYALAVRDAALTEDPASA